jgi:hypothetical protein
VDGLKDDVSFAWALIHLGIRANPPTIDEPPDATAIAAAFDAFDHLVAEGFVKLGRIDYTDPTTPRGSVAPTMHVEESTQVVRARVERACQTATDWSDWAHSCWIVNTAAGDAVARSAIAPES